MLTAIEQQEYRRKLNPVWAAGQALPLDIGQEEAPVSVERQQQTTRWRQLAATGPPPSTLQSGQIRPLHRDEALVWMLRMPS